MSSTPELLILSPRVARIWQSLREFWSTCLEMALLFRQGVTLPVLVVWASLLTTVIIHTLNSYQVLK